jgi:hypothetical protein
MVIKEMLATGEERTPDQLVKYCRGVYSPTEVKAMVLDLILLDILELTPNLTVRFKKIQGVV